MTFQAAPVAKPLGSVDRICKAGHIVALDCDGSYIVSNVTGEVNLLREDSGNYMPDVWIVHPNELSAESGFGRQL